jgi:hypothetical protein
MLALLNIMESREAMMRKNWLRHPAWLGLVMLIWVATGILPSAAQWQSQFGDPNKEWGTWWGQKETSRLGREDAVAKYNYCSTGGCVVRLESVDVKPNRARKGETIHLSTAYTILTPDGVAIPVVTSREIFFRGKSLGKTKNIETRRFNGTWNQEIDFALPENAAPGIYTLVTKINTGYGSDQKTTQFTVE